jgi:hypothetical protein
MNMAVSGAVGRGHAAHVRPANFGQLNAAIARGDLAAAQNAFTRLNESTAPAAMAAKARGSLDAVGAAIMSGDVEAARKSLADFRAGRIERTLPASAPAQAGAATPAPAPAPSLESAIDPLPGQPSTTEQIVALVTESGSTIDILA